MKDITINPDEIESFGPDKQSTFELLAINQTMASSPSRKSITSPLKAIRQYCLKCCCETPREVQDCPSRNCELYPFRLGINPFKKEIHLTKDEQKRRREILKTNRGELEK